MAENTNTTNTSEPTTKAGKERHESFYRDHKAPAGHVVKVVKNELVIETAKKKG